MAPFVDFISNYLPLFKLKWVYRLHLWFDLIQTCKMYSTNINFGFHDESVSLSIISSGYIYIGLPPLIVIKVDLYQ